MVLESVGHKFVQGFANIFFFSGAFIHRQSTQFPQPVLISVFSYEEQGGLTLRRPGHISDTGMAGGLCVSCSGV